MIYVNDNLSRFNLVTSWLQALWEIQGKEKHDLILMLPQSLCAVFELTFERGLKFAIVILVGRESFCQKFYCDKVCSSFT